MTDLYKKLNEVEVDLAEYDEANLSIIEEKRWENRVKKKLKSANHGSENKKRTIAAAVMASILGGGLLLSPAVQATIENLFSYSQVEEKAQTDIGWSWNGVSGDNTTGFDSINEIETKFDMAIPFPEQLQSIEEEAVTKEYSAETENGEFLSYTYHLRTEERMFRVTATNISKDEPEFTANTTKSAVIEKDVLIEGNTATLLGIDDINGCHLYVEQDQWKIVVSGFADTLNGEKNESNVTEEEMINIATSIDW